MLTAVLLAAAAGTTLPVLRSPKRPLMKLAPPLPPHVLNGTQVLNRVLLIHSGEHEGSHAICFALERMCVPNVDCSEQFCPWKWDSSKRGMSRIAGVTRYLQSHTKAVALFFPSAGTSRVAVTPYSDIAHSLDLSFMMIVRTNLEKWSMSMYTKFFSTPGIAKDPQFAMNKLGANLTLPKYVVDPARLKITAVRLVRRWHEKLYFARSVKQRVYLLAYERFLEGGDEYMASVAALMGVHEYAEANSKFPCQTKGTVAFVHKSEALHDYVENYWVVQKHFLTENYPTWAQLYAQKGVNHSRVRLV